LSVNREWVVVAMSGGVDSSVAALLLREEGYDVVGVHMSLWCEEKQGRGAQRRSCCSVDDLHDAGEVCRELGIPFYVFNFQDQFQASVVDYFCREYLRGRTPNPCLACNEHLKFNYLLRRAQALGSRYLATGHYARIRRDVAGYHLLKGVDPERDQSYFLYMLGQEDLCHLLFPLGGYTKGEVRDIAAQRGLSVAEKPDSVEICFVPDGDYRRFIESRFPSSPGDIVDDEGRVLGRHQGLSRYTIGQRKGLGLCGGSKMYVVAVDAVSNRLVVGPEDCLYSTVLKAGAVRWVGREMPEGVLDVTARIRYRSPEAAARVYSGNGCAEVRFEEAQRAIAPGQAVVFYSGEEVLGGGIIEGSEYAEDNAANLERRAATAGAGL
jgi:tRNA-specific 2-thiouridylase